MTIAVIMMTSSVAYVNTFDMPYTAEAPIDEILERRMGELLGMTREWPLSASECGATTKLEELLLEGVSDHHEAWEPWHDRFAQDGFELAMLLDNRHAKLGLHGRQDFVGVTRDVYYPDDFHRTTLTSGVSTVSGVEDLPVESVSIRYGHLVRMKGEAVQYQVQFETVGSSTQKDVWAPTALLPETETAEVSRAAVQNFAWIRNGRTLLSRELSPMEMAGSASIEFEIELFGAYGEAPAGTEVRVTFPRGWSEIFWAEHPAWSVAVAEVGAQTVVSATLLEPASSAVLALFAKPPSNPLRPYDVIHARLGGGSLGESSLVVEYPLSPSVQRDLPREVFPTTPYPVRAGSRAVFGVVVANGGAEVDVTQVDIAIPGGYDLFHNSGQGAPLFDPDQPAVGLDGGGGSWTVSADGKLVRWTGESRTIGASRAEEWVVELSVTQDPRVTTSVEPAWSEGATSTLRFANGYEHASTRWGRSPGVVAHRVPAASVDGDDGYPTRLQVHGFDGSIAAIGVGGVDGKGSYRVLATAADVVSVQHALANASVGPAQRLVRAGDVARVDVDLDSLASTLSGLGVTDATIVAELYAPSARACPTVSRVLPLQSLPAPAVRDVLVWDGGGAPMLFATLADHRVYAIAHGGRTVWSADVVGMWSNLTHGVVGGAPLLFVGTNAGTVHAFDPVSGAARWVAHLPAGATSLLMDSVRERLYVGTSAGSVHALDAATGTLRHSLVEAGLESVWRLVPTPGGDVLALAGSTLLRLSMELTERAGKLFDGPVLGAVETPSHVAVALPREVRLLAPATLAYADSVALEQGTVAFAGEGDATGDGVDDLVLAFSNALVHVFDGATGKVGWHGSTEWSEHVMGPHQFQEAPSQLECDPVSNTAAYTSPVSCGHTESIPEPTGLSVHAGGAVVTLQAPHQAHFWQGDDAGRGAAWTLPPEQAPTRARWGRWVTSDVVAVGDISGALRLFGPDPDAPPLFASRPSDRLAIGSFYFPVPEGGFLGTHVFRALVTWSQGGKTQTASLMDWFEVVPPDGVPEERSEYRIALVGEDRARPRDTA